MFEKKGAAIPVRLTAAERKQLSEIAEATGLTSSTLIRLLISALVRYYADNNSITLPIDLMDLFEKIAANEE